MSRVGHHSDGVRRRTAPDTDSKPTTATPEHPATRESHPMNTHETEAAGRCPSCSATVPNAFVLIEYEADDERRMYAECPACENVVRPQQSESSR